MAYWMVYLRSQTYAYGCGCGRGWSSEADEAAFDEECRRHGAPVVIVIDAEAMARDGAVFYLSENGVWLCDYIAPEYFLDPELTVEII